MTRKYSFFTVAPTSSSHDLVERTDNQHTICAIKGTVVLGYIHSYKPWKRFVFMPLVFMPHTNTVWSAGYLRDVLDAMEKIELERSDAALRRLIEEDIAKEAADAT